MFFEQPLESFINNVIFIDRSNNHKTRLEVVCILFCFLKITSFRTPHNNFKTLTLKSKLQREKKTRKVLSNTPSIVVFRRILSFSSSLQGKPTRAHTSGYSRQTKKCIKHAQTKYLSTDRLVFNTQSCGTYTQVNKKILAGELQSLKSEKKKPRWVLLTRKLYVRVLQMFELFFVPVKESDQIKVRQEIKDHRSPY